MSAEDTVELVSLGKYGLVLDVPAHTLPPHVWSNGNNVRFTASGVSRMRGHAQIFGALSVTPEFLMNVPSINASFWFYFSLLKAYVYDGAVHTDVTRVSGDYTAANGKGWTGTILGGVPVFNNGSDVPQYWSTLTPATKLTNLTNWPSTLRAKVVRAFGQYLIALNLTDSGTPLAQAIAWSSKADPGTIPTSWDDADPTVEAGRTQLTDIQGGAIVDGVLLGDMLIIYKERSIHALRFVGGVSVFAPDLLITTAGALAVGCACAFDKGTKHLVLTGDDIIVHEGTRQYKSVAEDRVKSTIFGEMDSANAINSFVFDNPVNKEVWVCYPEIGSTYPTKAAIWNYKDNNWTFRTFDGVSAATGTLTEADADVWDTDTDVWDVDSENWSTETTSKLVYVNRSEAFGLEASTYLFDGVVVPAFVERTEISIDGKDRDGAPIASLRSVKQVSRLWPRIIGTGTVNVQMGVQAGIGKAVTWEPVQQFIPGTTEYLDWNVQGRLLAIRFESLDGAYFRLEGYGLDVFRVSDM